ncbi:MAG TPA: DNA-binding protein [Candidatus Kryptobacter bacterium]|nr:DNA-binding protein [Candidatus Kryptobacter bacterium]
MQKLTLLLVILTIAGFAGAQETRTELTSASSSYDSKPNNDSIPDVYSVGGQLERVVVIRLKYQTDLLRGIEKAVNENSIRNAVILAGTGSVTTYHYHVVSNIGFPTRNIFIKNSESPADLVSMNGYIVNGRVHAHATFTNTDMAFGGHLEPGTTVFTFAIVTIGVLSDTTDLSHIDDKNYR